MSRDALNRGARRSDANQGDIAVDVSHCGSFWIVGRSDISGDILDLQVTVGVFDLHVSRDADDFHLSRPIVDVDATRHILNLGRGTLGDQFDSTMLS